MMRRLVALPTILPRGTRPSICRTPHGIFPFVLSLQASSPCRIGLVSVESFWVWTGMVWPLSPGWVWPCILHLLVFYCYALLVLFVILSCWIYSWGFYCTAHIHKGFFFAVISFWFKYDRHYKDIHDLSRLKKNNFAVFAGWTGKRKECSRRKPLISSV